ncbi:TPA: hypothetical protein ACGIJQ_000260 [Acinetobacter baumannii]
MKISRKQIQEEIELALWNGDWDRYHKLIEFVKEQALKGEG